jgi:hypothetical protein
VASARASHKVEKFQQETSTDAALFDPPG